MLVCDNMILCAHCVEMLELFKYLSADESLFSSISLAFVYPLDS